MSDFDGRISGKSSDRLLIDDPLKELLVQLDLPRTTSQCTLGPSSDWEQAQFWDQFLRSANARQLVENMKFKLQALGSTDSMEEDDYSSVIDAVSRYQSTPMGDIQSQWNEQDTCALSMLLLSERMYLEGAWEAQFG